MGRVTRTRDKHSKTHYVYYIKILCVMFIVSAIFCSMKVEYVEASSFPSEKPSWWPLGQAWPPTFTDKPGWWDWYRWRQGWEPWPPSWWPVSDTEPILFSFPKEIRVKVESNVLMLLDTSGSMSFQLDSDAPTWGDGSRPEKNGSTIRARYFGKDKNPGINQDDNNDTSIDFNYHPNLRYILSEDIGGISVENRNKYFARKTDEDLEPSENESEYKYPNDSRMYALRNVMYRILHDKNLYRGLRIALATYDQTLDSSFTTTADWYLWIPERVLKQFWNWYTTWWEWVLLGDLQKIFWKTGSATGLLRESFKSTSDTAHLLKLQEWFDGNAGERELRAQGGTPLSYSIYQKNPSYSTEKGSALQFFRAPNVITDTCQDNWLIVLTDGANTEGGGSPVDAVQNLCSTSLSVSGYPSVSAKKIKAFVIGLILPENESLAETLEQMAAKGNTGKSAYLANNMKGLFEALREIFFEIQDRSATGGAPLVSPGKTTIEDDGYYQATYHPRSGRQWEGDLVKRVKKADGSISEMWSAASLLLKKNAATRSIFTAFQGVSNPYDFAYTADLQSVLGIPNIDNTKHFIDWLRNGETYQENHYKLFDIFRSGVVKIGTPSGFVSDALYRDFVTQHYNRETLIYVQSNAGMLHAFRDADEKIGETVIKEGGDEVFAFIPPNVLSANRLRGLRWNDSMSTGGGYDTTYSYSRHLLDGPLIAEDVFAKGKYRTLLMGLLGLGGAGMYVVDVSDAKTPSLLWAVENAIYKSDEAALITDVTKRSVLTWQAKSDIVEASAPYWHTVSDDLFTEKEYNYMKLRHTVSTPFIGRVLLQEAGKDVPEWVWVFIMGNGTPGSVAEDDDGSKKGVIYIGRMEDGKIIERIPVDDAVVSPVAALFEGSRGVIKTFFVGDRAGMLYKGDLSSTSSSEWKDKLQPIFDFQANQGLSYSIDATKIKKQLWVVAGTGDVEDYLGAPGADEQHYFVALNVSDVANIANFPVKRDTLSALSAESASIAAPLGAGGWRINLLKKTEKFGFERMSTPPFIYKGYVFFSTFRPDLDPCSDSGSSRVYAMKVATGEGVIGDKKYIELPDTLISGISISKGELVLGVTKYGSGAVPGFVQVGENMLLMDISWLPNEADDESGLMKPLYWKSR